MKFKQFNFHETLSESTNAEASPEQVITKVDKLIFSLRTLQDDPENLSKALDNLAILARLLGKFLVAAEEEANITKTQYNYLLNKQTLEYISGGKAAGVSETMAKQALKPELDTLYKWQHNVSVLKIARDDIDRIINTNRTRISLIKGDIRSEA